MDEKPFRELEESILERVSDGTYRLTRMIEYNALGTFRVFCAALLAVIIGGYIVKHWL